MMPILAGQCCPCAECTFFSDSFASDDLGDNYDVDAGSFSIAAGKLTTSTSNSELHGLVESPLADGNIKITGKLYFHHIGDSVKIIVNRVDANNKWFVEIAAGSTGYIRIVQMVAGVSTEFAICDISNITDVASIFCVSVEGQRKLQAFVTDEDGTEHGIRYTGADDSFDEPGWGLGVGAVNTTISVSNLVVSKTDATDCHPCEQFRCGTAACDVCADGTIADSYLVNIPADTFGDDFCDACTPQNGNDYVLSNLSNCEWLYLASPFCGTVFISEFSIGLDITLSGGNITVRALVSLIQNGVNGNYATWSKTISGDDCNFVDLELDFVSNAPITVFGVPGNQACSVDTSKKLTVNAI